MRHLAIVLALASGVLLAGCAAPRTPAPSATRPSPMPSPRRSAPAPQADRASVLSSTPPRWVARELWRTPLGPIAPRCVSAGAGGGLLVAGHIEGEVTLVGERVASAGGDDVVLLAVSDEGRPRLAGHIGSNEDDDVEDLVAMAASHLLAVTTEGLLALGGTTVAPRPGTRALLPRAAAVVTLDARGTPVRLREAPDAPREVVVASVAGGDVIVASSFTGEDELFGHAVVERLGVEGALRWRLRLPDVEIHRVAMVGGHVALSVRGHHSLATWMLAADTGVVTDRSGLQKPSGTGDLGALEGVIPLTDGAVALGETGDDVEVGGQVIARRPLSIQPFALVTGTGVAPVFVDLADVVGRVHAVGVLGGRPAAVVEVIHGGPDPALHRGVHVVVLGAPPLFIPLSTHRHPGDDGEHTDPEQVIGEPLDPVDALILGDAVAGEGRGVGTVAILGRCGTRPRGLVDTRSGCIVHYAVGP